MYLVDEAGADDVLGCHELNQALPSLVAGREGLRQQVLHVVDLDAALPHPGDELVVLPLGPLDPEHVVEQQLVVIAGREALQAELRSMDDDLAQLPDLGVDSEVAIASVSLLVRAGPIHPGTICVPAVPATRFSMSASVPIAGSLAGCPANSFAAATFGPIEPAGNAIACRAAALTRSSFRWSGVPQSGVDRVDVGGHHVDVGFEVTGQETAREVLVDHGLDADEPRLSPRL